MSANLFRPRSDLNGLTLKHVKCRSAYTRAQSWIPLNMDHFVYAFNQWGATLHCNVVSHWLGAYTKWSCPLCLQISEAVIINFGSLYTRNRRLYVLILDMINCPGEMVSLSICVKVFFLLFSTLLRVFGTTPGCQCRLWPWVAYIARLSGRVQRPNTQLNDNRLTWRWLFVWVLQIKSVPNWKWVSGAFILWAASVIHSFIWPSSRNTGKRIPDNSLWPGNDIRIWRSRTVKLRCVHTHLFT